jgi:phosphatidylglycerophosphatase C
MKDGLALFDFDGTISNSDSATLFYKSLYKNRIVYLFKHVLLCLPELIKYRCDFTDYMSLKRKRLQVHVGSLSQEEYENRILHFHNSILPTVIREGALKRIGWHKAKSHDVWIVSASFDFLLSNWCEELDIQLLVNRTIKAQGICLFEGDDCNFSGKVTFIKKNINLADYARIYAYGDSDGDNAMLSLAHEPYYNYFI